jgi:cobalamin-dependent methionine synthase I
MLPGDDEEEFPAALLIGGATTSRMHTAVKIAPNTPMALFRARRFTQRDGCGIIVEC